MSSHNPAVPIDRTIFFSHRLGVHRPSRTGTKSPATSDCPHDLVGARICDAINGLGIRTRELIRPEIYASRESYALLPDFSHGGMHIIFKPIEEIRILRTAFNVGCVIWEFPWLNERAHSTDPLTDHLRMLRNLDEIWCHCTFTHDVLCQYFANVHLIPPPIPMNLATPFRLPRGTRIPDQLSTVPCISLKTWRKQTLANLLGQVPSPHWVLLSVCNPRDQRKNVRAMIESFSLFQRDKPGAVLLMSCAVDDAASKLRNVHALFDRHIYLDGVSSNIFVLTEELDSDRLRALYRSCDFYFCASHCEGLGLPIIEGMAEGLVPISVSNTAMADYVTDKNAFVIPSRLEPAYAGSNGFAKPGHSWFTTSIDSIISALERAYHCPPSSLDRMRIAAAETVNKQYSFATAADSIAARLLDRCRIDQHGRGLIE